jgi:hypothetical protein
MTCDGCSLLVTNSYPSCSLAAAAACYRGGFLVKLDTSRLLEKMKYRRKRRKKYIDRRNKEEKNK